MISSHSLTIAGLVDAQHHLAFGDHDPASDAHGHLERTVAAGTTTVVSVGATSIPGAPRQGRAAAYLAVLATRSWRHESPGGIRVDAGALVAWDGISDADVALAASAEVSRLVIAAPTATAAEASRIARLARDHQLRVVAVCGHLAQDTLRALAPDIYLGADALPVADALRLLEDANVVLGLSARGNVAAARRIVDEAARRDALGRIVLGSDGPAEGTIDPAAIGRFVALLAALCEISPSAALHLASDNAVRTFGLTPGPRVVLDAPAGHASPLDAIAAGVWPTPRALVIDDTVRELR